MDAKYPIELFASVRDIKKYNDELYSFIKSYGFRLKPTSNILLAAIPGFFMIYVTDKNSKYNQKYVTNSLDFYNLKRNIDDYYYNIEWQEKFKSFKETAATKINF